MREDPEGANSGESSGREGVCLCSVSSSTAPHRGLFELHALLGVVELCPAPVLPLLLQRPHLHRHAAKKVPRLGPTTIPPWPMVLRVRLQCGRRSRVATQSWSGQVVVVDCEFDLRHVKSVTIVRHLLSVTIVRHCRAVQASRLLACWQLVTKERKSPPQDVGDGAVGARHVF